MITKIRIQLEYNTYCLWLYDENDDIIDNDNPPEWDDLELTNAFMAVSDLYDTFFVDNDNEFIYKGCPDKKTSMELKKLFSNAVSILYAKNNGKYIIQNDVKDDFFDKL
ncbi:MAG: hypothetical protein LIO41_05445 [Ruminococcus sp.]|nr:hypothetical protein [Ruminococcus sp.]